MEDNTIITLFSIGTGAALLLVSIVLGNMNDAVIAISAAAIGVGAGVSIPIGAKKVT